MSPQRVLDIDPEEPIGLDRNRTRPGRHCPPPPPAEITYTGEYSINPLGEASFGKLCAQIPTVLRRIVAMAWRIDRTAVALLLACPVLVGVAAAVSWLRPLGHAPILTDGTVTDRLHQAAPALVVVGIAAGLARIAGTVATYAERRITPRLTTETDTALGSGLPCRASAHTVDGFSDRQEAAEMGVIRTHVMVTDAQRFLSALVKMVTASAAISVLNPLLLPLLLLAVLPAGVGAILTARVDYEIHYANVADRNVRA